MIMKERDHDGSIAPRDLTRRQAEVMRTILEYLRENTTYPSIRDLMALLNIRSPNGVRSLLQPLQTKGWITGVDQVEQRARSIRAIGLRVVLAYDDTPQAQRLRELIEG